MTIVSQCSLLQCAVHGRRISLVALITEWIFVQVPGISGKLPDASMPSAADPSLEQVSGVLPTVDMTGPDAKAGALPTADVKLPEADTSMPSMSVPDTSSTTLSLSLIHISEPTRPY